MAKKLYLIDGSAMAYRAYFAFIRNPLRNSKGENTSAAFGVANSMLKLYREERPDYWVCVFDTPHPTFRHEMFPAYKATRDKMPEEMVAQLPRVRELITTLGCPLVEMPGYEADDVIATLAVQAEANGIDAVMVTGDKDFMQLVTERITILNWRRTSGAEHIERLDPAGVEEKFGVPPHQVIDVLGLAGDASDNVPGIPGVGPKTAVSLVRKFGDLESVLAHATAAPGKKLRERLTEHADLARLSRELVTIKRDVPLALDVAAYVVQPLNSAATRKLFLELEFTSLWRQIDTVPAKQPVGPEPPAAMAGKYHTVATLDELARLAAVWRQAPLLAVDTETTSLDPVEAELVGISICIAPGEAWYIPVGHNDSAGNLDRERALAILRPLLENEHPQLVGQNGKYDWQIFFTYGIVLRGLVFDPMLASYVLNPSARGHSLDALAKKHLDYDMQPISELIGSGPQQRSFAEVDIKAATHYAAEDADFTLRLAGALRPKLKPAGLETLFDTVEMPLVPVLARMEYDGVSVDVPYLKKLSAAWQRKLTALTRKIYETAGEEFNINSTQQLATILFDKLNLHSARKTARTAQRATDVSTLEKLAAHHPLPGLILEYRGVSKLKSTYADALVKLVSARTGRVHTSFNQAVAATGRLSSSDPNLQNIPIRTSDGQKIRRAFIPKPGYTLLVADYSQIELRLMAHFSGDPTLCTAFINGEDIHAKTAADIFGVPLEAVDAERRRWAKSANFGIIYGLSAFGLSQQTDMTVREAKDFIDTYFRRYPRVRDFIDSAIAQARKDGYVTTLFGRRRLLPEIRSDNRQRREFAERIAVNTPLQGTAADIIKKAMVEIAADLTGKQSMMVLQVHDELVFDVHPDELEWLAAMVRDRMENTVQLAVPLTVDIGVGENWLEAK